MLAFSEFLYFLFLSSDSGISLENGVFVTAIVQGSPAARDGSLTVGDRLIAVSTHNCSSLRVQIHDWFHFVSHSKAQIRWDLVEYVNLKDYQKESLIKSSNVQP